MEVVLGELEARSSIVVEGSSGDDTACCSLVDKPSERLFVAQAGLGERAGDGHAVHGVGGLRSLH